MGTGYDPRYSRHVALAQVGPEGQARLAAASVFVLGLGGLGTVASLYLANSGIGRLVLNDFDRVDATNLPRQILYGPQDVGRPKAEVAAARLRAANPEVRVETLDGRLDAAALAGAIDGLSLVLDGTDNFAARLAINAACVRMARPLISGAAIRFEGQVAVFADPGGGGPCYRCLWSDADEGLGDCAGQGVLAPVAGTVGMMMATEALKHLLGLDSGLRNRLWVYDALRGSSRSLAIPRAPGCPACGARPGPGAPGVQDPR